MRWLKLLLALGACLGQSALPAATARIVKVLPHHLDREGRVALAPSLFERDAYQAWLRAHPERQAGLRFDVQWKSSTRGPLLLRVELRGVHDQKATTAQIEGPVRRVGWFGRWASLSLTGKDFRAFGELRAWRATLWDGPSLLAEQKSFLW